MSKPANSADFIREVIEDALNDAMRDVFDHVARTLDYIPDYDARQVAANRMIEEFQRELCTTWRDDAMSIFSRHLEND